MKIESSIFDSNINKTLYKYSIINSKPKYLQRKFILLIVPIKISILNCSQLFLRHLVTNRVCCNIDMNYFLTLASFLD